MYISFFIPTNKLFEKYDRILKLFCIRNDYLYINPNEYIFNIMKQNYSKFMIDHIHPNNKYGIELYSEAVLYNSP